MPLDRDALERLLPHRGAMRLLDSVVSWDDVTIECRASTHRAAGNPLRQDGRLPAVVAIEYAAQAMAVHGGLHAAPGHAAPLGYLVAVRDARLLVATLDEITDDLEISATRHIADASGLVYAFVVQAGGRRIADGRATAVLLTRSAP